MFNVYMDDNRIGPGSDYTASDFHVSVGWEKWVIVRSVKSVKELLQSGLVNDLSLDHDMAYNSETGKENENGSDLVRWMIEEGHWPKGLITIHSQNHIKAQQMRDDINRFRPVEKETDIITIRQEDWT
jgi:hypothetical protein